MKTKAKPKRKSRSGTSIPQALRPGVRIEARLPEELAAKLDEYCKHRECSRNEGVQKALRAFLTHTVVGK